MRSVVALRAFPYSKDGINVEEIAVDQQFDCRDDLYDGLVAEKYIVPASAETAIVVTSTAPTWPSEEELADMGHAPLGDLLAAHGVDEDTIKALNSKELRRGKVKELMASGAAA